MKYIKIAMLTFLFSTTLQAQFFNEIKSLDEFGIFIGGVNYIGDIGRETYIAPNNLAIGLIYRRKINARISFRTTAGYYKIKDDDSKSSNETRNIRGAEFTNEIKELAIGLELNLWKYDHEDARKKYTPYLVTELAFISYNVVNSEISKEVYNYNKKISIIIPLGLGIKSKIAKNTSLAFEARAQYTFVDDLDYNNTKIKSLQFGNPDNNDWYFFTGVSISHSFGRTRCVLP